MNSADDCPFGFDDTDADADGICVEADALPMLEGDRVRCLMSFRNVRLNNDLWIPRGDASAWNLFVLGTIGGRGTGTVVAAETLEATGTTGYSVQLQVIDRPDPALPTGVTFWLRTTETAAASDVGCEVRGDGASSTVRVVGGTNPSAIATVTQPINMLVLAQAVIEPGTTGRANVACTARWWSVTSTVTDAVILPPGRFGFSLENAAGYMLSLVVTERDDAPAL